MFNRFVIKGSVEPFILTKHQTGFTLVEMILTIIVLSVLSYIAFSQEFNFSTHDDSNAYQQSLSVIRNTQKYAISRRTSAYLVVNNSQIIGCWDASCASQIITMDGGPLQTDLFSNKFSSSGTPIVFLSDGGTSSQVIITIGSSTLTIENITGYAH